MEEPHEFTKNEVFSVGGWVFKVRKITGKGMILETLGVVQEEKESIIIKPDTSIITIH